MLIRFLSLRLKKEIVILFYPIILISIKSQFVSNKRQKGSRSRLGEDQGRMGNSRGGGSTLNPRLGVSVGSLPWGSGDSVRRTQKIVRPSGDGGYWRNSVLQKQRTKAHGNLLRLWQLAQSLHSSKPEGIWPKRWEVDTVPSLKPEAIFHRSASSTSSRWPTGNNSMVFLEMFYLICFDFGFCLFVLLLFAGF